MERHVGAHQNPDDSLHESSKGERSMLNKLVSKMDRELDVLRITNYTIILVSINRNGSP